MNRIQNKNRLLVTALLMLCLTACGQTQEQIEITASANRKPIEKLMEKEVLPEDTSTENNNVAAEIETNIPAEEEQTKETTDEEVLTNETTEEDLDNPYRINAWVAVSGAWMEALYETHKGALEIETEEIIYTFDVNTEKYPRYGSHTYQVTIPNFPEAKNDAALQKIEQWYSEQDWILTQEEKEEYEALVEFYEVNGSDSYDFWKVYKQDQFITVIFEDRWDWGRLYSDPYADVFWADTGEHVTLRDLFGDREEELKQVLIENGRYIPIGCVMEEWESWELISDVRFEVPLPMETDQCFYPTPYGMVFSYPTGEIDAIASGTVLIFVDWGSLEGVCMF